MPLISYFSLSLQAAEFPIEEKYIRFEENKIQLAKKTFRNNAGMSITLLAAQHVADSDFYEAHKILLEQADMVLFEGKGLDEEGSKFNLSELGQLNRKITDRHFLVANAFGLSYQLDYTDYRKSNFIHADYSFEQTATMEKFDTIEAMISQIKKNIEDIKEKFSHQSNEPLQFYFEQEVNKFSELGIAAYFSQAIPFLLMDEMQLKQKINNAEWYENEFTKRNQIVEEKLAEILGKQQTQSQKAPHIIIYYGAAHMPHFERVIKERYSFLPESQEWFTSISLE